MHQIPISEKGVSGRDRTREGILFSLFPRSSLRALILKHPTQAHLCPLLPTEGDSAGCYQPIPVSSISSAGKAALMWRFWVSYVEESCLPGSGKKNETKYSYAKVLN